MGRGTERLITCLKPGCGYTYKHKRMECKGWKQERLVHIASGECARRVHESRTRAEDKTDGVSMNEVRQMVDDMVAPLYDLLRVQDAKHEELKQRVVARLEARKKRKHYIERDSKPKPWQMARCVEELKLREDLGVVEAFKETMTKEYTHGWSWQVSLSAWFHWLLDQCSCDPILLMSKDYIRYVDHQGVQQVTKLQFFRCFGKFNRWDPLDGFFVGFWYPLVVACKKLTNWNNRIIFDLPCSEQQKRTFDKVWHDGFADIREPNLSMDRAIAQVFYDVLKTRKRQRRELIQDDEKSSPK